MFDWWTDLPKPARYGAALVFLAVGGVFLLGGYFVPWPWAVGGVLLVAAMVVDD